MCCVCGLGCISSDKVVLNMFAQGPQGEKGPLTHEGLEPHTHTHTKLANTTCKYRKRHGKLMYTHTHNFGVSLNLEERVDNTHKL